MGTLFKILSIDGGGIRGVVPAYILKNAAEKYNVRVSDHFDMIAGTSTGSIIAAAIACNHDPNKIVSLYREKGFKIFKLTSSWWPKKYRLAFHSLYGSSYLQEALSEFFGDTRLGEVTIPLLIPATDIGTGGVHVFKSGYSRDFVRDNNVLVSDAVLASCAAPTFFKPHRVDEYLLSDGGLWANNPSLAAVIDAKRRLSVEIENIRILSLGTGHSRTSYGLNSCKQWGLLNGWKGKEFMNFLMSLQAQSTHNYLQLMLEKQQMLRLNFESDMPLPMDDCSAIDDLVSRADKIFTHQNAEIRRYFSNDREG